MNPFIIEKASGKYSMLSAESGELTREWIEKIGEARSAYWQRVQNQNIGTSAGTKGGDKGPPADAGVWRQAGKGENTYFYNSITLESRPTMPGENVELISNAAGTEATLPALPQGGEEYVGKQVLKAFDDEVYSGLVLQFIPASEDTGEPDLWWIKYSDGDEEDVELKELEAAINFNEEMGGSIEAAMKALKLGKA